ncbi:MAG: hypothetical protein V7K68_00545 [Nostoc sp.]|uniref:hypothetical protein n=1 Tax=Nostoc sp. TaxID=1180 RepID=UPI002FF99143
MNNENTTNDIPQPDPTWDYYLTWHKLFKAKSHLAELIQYVGRFESEETEINERIESDLVEIIRSLQDVLPKIEAE